MQTLQSSLIIEAPNLTTTPPQFTATVCAGCILTPAQTFQKVFFSVFQGRHTHQTLLQSLKGSCIPLSAFLNSYLWARQFLCPCKRVRSSHKMHTMILDFSSCSLSSPPVPPRLCSALPPCTLKSSCTPKSSCTSKSSCTLCPAPSVPGHTQTHQTLDPPASANKTHISSFLSFPITWLIITSIFTITLPTLNKHTEFYTPKKVDFFLQKHTITNNIIIIRSTAI